MGKKEKAIFALAEDFKAITSLVPKLENLIKVHKEIAAGYQKYRKSGGAAISGVEKHLGIPDLVSAPVKKKDVTAPAIADKTPKADTSVKKSKSKLKA
jgi:hypothetical protein